MMIAMRLRSSASSTGTGSSSPGERARGQAGAVAVVLGPNVPACQNLHESGVPVVMADSTSPRHPYKGLEFQRVPTYGIRENEPGWLPEMLRLGERLARRGKPVLFPCTDEALAAVARERAALDKAFVVASPPPDVVMRMINKADFAIWAEQNGIRTPRSAVATDQASLERAAASFELPCIVKPEFTSVLETLEDTKLLFARERGEIVDFGQRILAHGMRVILQEDLTRDGTIQWSLAGICDDKSVIRQALLARKLRQRPWGAGTAVETMPMDEVLRAIGQDFVSKARLTGLFELELRPSRDGTPMVIEMNPRIWTQVRLAAHAGLNVLHAAYKAALGEPIEERRRYKPYVGWIGWRRDLSRSQQMLLAREISLGDLLRSWARVRIVD
jgi:predicted ATP-grasp superfamily ATP-dependent carboligase